MPWRPILLLLVAVHAQACVDYLGWPSVKQNWSSASAVFLGTVELASPDEGDRQMTFQEQSVRIKVDKAFKGVTLGQTILMQLAANDCAAKFKTGQREVFYLGSKAGSWFVTALGNPDPTGDDMLFLRGLPKSAFGTRLSGEVELYEDRRVGGVPNVKVKISGPAGYSRETTTSPDGAYEVYGLNPGRYTVSLEVPKGLKINFPTVSGAREVPGNKTTVDLAPDGGASVGFVLKADTKISGRILRTNGKPLPHACIDLEPIQGRTEAGKQFYDCSTEDGRFEATMMAPGTYWLLAHDDVKANGFKSESTLYYPGVRDRQRATTISIEAGHYLNDLEIKLPTDEKRYTIAGRMQFADGAPAPGASVTFASPEHGYIETTSTLQNGSFSLSLVAGMDGELSGRLGIMEPMLAKCPEFQVGPSRAASFASWTQPQLPSQPIPAAAT